MSNHAPNYFLDVQISIRSVNGAELPPQVKVEDLQLECACCREVKHIQMAMINLVSDKVFIFCGDCQTHLASSCISLCARAVEQYERRLRQSPRVPANGRKPN